MKSASKNFALMGVAAFVAPRHLKAIRDTNNVLLAAFDKFDNVGHIDDYFPDAHFFVEFERFERHINKLNREGKNIEYISVCTPNYLHDSHIRFALNQGAHAICEKPLVLSPWNLDALEEAEKESSKKIYNILQSRLHPSIRKLKKRIEDSPQDKVYDVDLNYITSRGKWYHASWKGSDEKSGGIVTDIGVHFCDMLTWIFGDVKENVVHLLEHNKAAGFLGLERARVRWFLSIDYNDLPDEIKNKGQRTYRLINVDNEELEFSDGFADLHTESYKKIMEGKGFGLDDARRSIEVVYAIRNSKPVGMRGEYNPYLKKVL